MVSCTVSSLRRFFSSSSAFFMASGMLMVNFAIGTSLDSYRLLWKYLNRGNDKDRERSLNKSFEFLKWLVKPGLSASGACHRLAPIEGQKENEIGES